MATIFKTPSFSFMITTLSSFIEIAAEPHPSQKIFTITIDKDSISQTTNNLFDNPDNLIQGFQDAANKAYPGLSLDIDSQGKLTYNVVFSAGVIRKKFSFTLDLEEVIPSNPVEMTESSFKSCGESIENNEILKYKDIHDQKLREEFENVMVQMKQKIAELEKSYKELRAPIPLRLEIHFNEASDYASKYTLSENNKRAKLAKTSNYPNLELHPQIPSNGQYSCSIKINNKIQKLYFGITNDVKEFGYDDECFYEFSTRSGKISGQAIKFPREEGSFGDRDSVLKMIVDMDRGILTFFVDDQQVNSCDILKSNAYFAYVSLRDIGDSVTLI